MKDKYFKAFIRVVKSLNKDHFYNTFASQNIVEEKLILAKDKGEVKEILLSKYPQFFQNGKVYSKETKDEAQFFYVVIFELFEYEKNQVVNGTSWECSHCKQKYPDTYQYRPKTYERLFPNLKFCKSDDDHCFNEFKKEYYKDVELQDDHYYVSKTSPNYIYKITEKHSNKCYVGKTRNAPFFRWWNHLTHSSSPFGLYLRQTKLSDWIFEVLEELPPNISDEEVFKIESHYIMKFNSIESGFNSVISKKQTLG